MRIVFLRVVLLVSSTASSFCPSRSSLPRKTSVFLRSGVQEATKEPTSTRVQAALTFNCDRVFESEPFAQSSPNEIYEFFQMTESRNCMISAGNTRPVEETETTVGILKEWLERGRGLGAMDPEMTDAVLEVGTSAMEFPGLSVTSSALIGCKLLEPISEAYPKYEFTLIKDQRTVEGFAPTVWIFNKLTGHNDDGTSASSAAPISLSCVTAEQTHDGQTIFKFPVKFTINVNFPTLLLKLLPISKEKTEEEGSKAIAKTLEKDLSKVMLQLRKQFLDYKSAKAPY